MQIKRPDNLILRYKATALLISIFRAIFLITMSFVIVYPILYMISLSIRDVKDLYDVTVIWVPKNFTAENYKAVIEAMDYFPRLIKTIISTTISTFLNVAICAITGYGFARQNFKGRGLLFGLVILTIIVPPQTISIPMFMQYYAFDFLGLGLIGELFIGHPFSINLLNTSFTFYIPAILGMGLRSGLFIYIFRQFFRGMPEELEDASYIDGCNTFMTFIRIMLPNAGPAILTSTMFSFVWYWNDYYLSTLYFDEPSTLSVSLSRLESALSSAGNAANVDPFAVFLKLQAGCVLLILPLVIAFIFLQSKFTESIDKTGIVG